jgi:Calcineurin-like phosphoesterase
MARRAENAAQISRRRLLQWGLAGGTALFGGGSARGEDEKPVCRFVQINDLHVQASEPAVRPAQETYKHANERARWLVEAINRETFCPLPEFVVGVGDLIHGEGLERFEPDLKTLQEIIKPLRCPFYPVVGNHEVMQQERSSKCLKPYCDAFGKDRVDYTFTRAGIVFIALNNSGAPDPGAAKERNKWLREALKDGRDQPKIVLCHIPLIPLRDKATLAKSFGFPSDYDHDAGTLKLLEEHADTMIAVLSGHLHLTGVKSQRDILHVSLAGTASYPSDGAAVYEVFPDRIEVAVKQLPEKLARTEPSIHGRGRHGKDFTDSEHRTAEEYQCGLAEERRFKTPLAGGKRPQSKK